MAKRQNLVEKAKSASDRSLERKIQNAEEELKVLKTKYKFACDEIASLEAKFKIVNDIKHVTKEMSFNKLKASGESTAILVLSDWHAGETVDPSTINDLNEFSVEIFEKRAKACFEHAVMMLEVQRGLTKIDSLVVACIGDFISGALHDDQRESDELSPSESIMLCQDTIANGLAFLKKETAMKHVTVVTCFGNHGRTTAKPRASTAHITSYEQIMYWQLAKTCKEYSWKVGNGYHNYLSIYDRQYRFHHGDSIKYLGGVGGLQIPAMKAISDWDRTISAYYDIFGHYHTTSFARKYSSNGSLVGYNAFALRNKCAFEEPSQNLILSSKKRGNILATQIFAT